METSGKEKTWLAAMVGVLGLVLWLLIVALPSPSPTGELPSSSAVASPEADRPTRPALRNDLLSDELSTASVDTSRAADMRPPHEPVASFQTSARPDPSPASFAAGSSSASTEPLPLASEEVAPDGLPAAAMHCTFDGGIMTCGNCRLDSDCPAGQGCVMNRETRRFECLPSDCEEDSHCFPGFTCRVANTGASGPIIRRCTPEGVRAEGEACDSGYISRSGACREGLRCIYNVCTVPCQLDTPGSCPSGYSCEDGEDGPGCFPDCRQLGCHQGQQCKRIIDSRYQCLASVSGTCPETPCAQGELCVKRVMRGRGAFWCARSCNPILPDSCPSGYVCGWATDTTSACFRKCDPNDLDSCDKGWICGTVSEDLSLWGCNLDFHG